MQTGYSQAVQIFEGIRDTPTVIPTNACYVKNQVLVKTFNEQEMDARLVLAEFSWTDLFKYIRTHDSSLYDYLTALEQYLKDHKSFDKGMHVYAQVKTGPEYINVDATWDKALQRAFPICEWDGKSNGQLAVPVRKLYTPEESRSMLQDPEAERAATKSISENIQFFLDLNSLFSVVRRNN